MPLSVLGSPSQTSASVKVTITVEEVNDNRPLFNQPYYRQTVSENLPVGSSVLQLSATDADVGPITNEYEFVALENTTDFSISLNGEITVSRILDYERETHYSLVAVVQDKGSPALSSRAIVDIIISDVNDVRPTFPTTFFVNRISEKAPIGQSVATLHAFDVDTSVLTYSFISGKSPLFALEGNIVMIASKLPQQGTFTMSFKANDGIGDSTNVATVVITVEDVNNNQPRFTTSIYDVTISESTGINTSILSVSATDGDDSNKHRNIIYSIEPHGFDSGNFTAVGSIILTKSTFDYEHVKLYTFHVLAVNQNSDDQLSARALVRVHIQDENDNSPVPPARDVTLTISEGTLVGSVLYNTQATDADSTTNGQLQYIITNAVTFEVDNNGNVKLKSQLDAFVKSTYRFAVQISDKGTPSPRTVLVSFTLKVSGVTLPGIQITGCPKTLSVLENTASQTVQALNTADSGIYISQEITYTVRSGDIGIFALNSSSGEISVSSAGNYEVKRQYDWLVQATNERGAKAYCLVTGVIRDANEPPALVRSSYQFNVSECASPYTVISSVQSTDADTEMANIAHAYSLDFSQNPLAAKVFAIDNYGRIKLLKSVDYETINAYTFNVVVTDSGSPALSASASVAVNVLDCNDNAPILSYSPSVNFVRENTKPISFGRITADDIDSGFNRQIEFIGVYPQGIVSINKRNGGMNIIGELDYEKRQSYDFIAVAKDLGSPAMTSSVAFKLSVSNENDNIPVFQQLVYNVTVSSKSSIGTTVVRVEASDADLERPGQIASYKITTDNSENTFRVDTQGNIITQRALNLAPVHIKYELMVSAFDTDGRQNTNATKVIVNIVNYTQPYFSAASYITTVAENNPTNTAILTISATSNVSPASLTFDIVVDPSHLDYQNFRLVSSGNNQVQVLPTIQFDYEKKTLYSFNVRVKDAFEQETRALIVVKVTILLFLLRVYYVFRTYIFVFYKQVKGSGKSKP